MYEMNSKVTQFLNDFDASMRFKLSQINERLVALERTIENCELSSGYLSNEVINRGVAKGTSFNKSGVLTITFRPFFLYLSQYFSGFDLKSGCP